MLKDPVKNFRGGQPPREFFIFVVCIIVNFKSFEKDIARHPGERTRGFNCGRP